MEKIGKLHGDHGGFAWSYNLIGRLRILLKILLKHSFNDYLT
jgi:hypothetical protein